MRNCTATARGRRSDYPCEGKRNLCFLRQQWSKWRKTTDRSSSELLFLIICFPRVYDGIEASLAEKGYGIEVAVTKNRLNDEAIYLEGLLKSNVSGLIIEGSRSAFPNPNIRLYKEIKRKIFRRCLSIIIMKMCHLTVWKCRIPDRLTS